MGIPSFSIWTSLLAPLTSRSTGVTRYPAPYKYGRVRTFLSFIKIKEQPSCAGIMQYNKYLRNTYSEIYTTTISPISTPSCSTNPAFASITYQAGIGEPKDFGYVSGDTFSSMCTTSLSLVTHMISNG